MIIFIFITNCTIFIFMSTIVSLLEIHYPLLYLVLVYKLLVNLDAFMTSKLQLAAQAMANNWK